jgi:hypothetical protein
MLANCISNSVKDNSVIELNIPENGKVQIDLLNTLRQKVTIIYSGS